MTILQLKKIRIKLGLSRTDFAKRIKISKETLDNWEYRSKSIPIDKQEYLSILFDDYEKKDNTPFNNQSIEEKLESIYLQNKNIQQDLKNQNNENLKVIFDQLKLNFFATDNAEINILEKMESLVEFKNKKTE